MKYTQSFYSNSIEMMVQDLGKNAVGFTSWLNEHYKYDSDEEMYYYKHRDPDEENIDFEILPDLLQLYYEIVVGESTEDEEV